MRKFLALFLLFPATLSAQTGDQALRGSAPALDRGAETVTYSFLTHVMGFTICHEGRGYAFIIAGLSELERIDTEAHELKHKEQMARYPDCDTFDRFVRASPSNMIEIEAEAYAAGLCVSVANGADKVSLMRNYAERISYWVTDGPGAMITVLGILQKYIKC